MANQVQAVKDTLDWREQFKKRPVVWSAAAMGVGFCTGYCIANYVKARAATTPRRSIVMVKSRDTILRREWSAAPRCLLPPACMRNKETAHTTRDQTFFQKIANTPAFEKVQRRGRKHRRRCCAGAFEDGEDGGATGTDHFAAKLHRGSSSQRRSARGYSKRPQLSTSARTQPDLVI